MKLRSTQQVFCSKILTNIRTDLSQKKKKRLQKRRHRCRRHQHQHRQLHRHQMAPQESQPEQTAAAPEDSKKEVSLDDLYHLKDVSILYTSYRLADKYGSSQIRAEQGKKLLVAEFSLKNNSGAKKKVKLIDRRKITYQLNVDGTTYSPQISLLENQLDYLETVIAKGKSQKAVLVFQVDKNATNASSIDLSIEEGNNKTSVKMK